MSAQTIADPFALMEKFEAAPRGAGTDGKVLESAKKRRSEVEAELSCCDREAAMRLIGERRELAATIQIERRAWLTKRLTEAVTVRDMAAQVVLVTTAELERLSSK